MSEADADPSIAVVVAGREDLDEVLALLAEVDLPAEGVEAHVGDFLLARGAGARLLGCAGLERHGRVGLLRSVAVSTSLQRSGLGSRLVAETLAYAARSHLSEVVLLTTTAKNFFIERFGFAPADRSEYDERLAGSPEWTLPRCSSAAFLRLEVGGNQESPE